MILPCLICFLESDKVWLLSCIEKRKTPARSISTLCSRNHQNEYLFNIPARKKVDTKQWTACTRSNRRFSWLSSCVCVLCCVVYLVEKASLLQAWHGRRPVAKQRWKTSAVQFIREARSKDSGIGDMKIWAIYYLICGELDYIGSYRFCDISAPYCFKRVFAFKRN